MSVCVHVYLVHHKGLDLTLEDLHASCRDDRANVWHDNFTEDVTDEAVVSLETGSSCVLHGEAVIVVWGGTEDEVDEIRKEPSRAI